ncbi:hypothetical protein HanRHA438_Chr16g0753391 [Helianthus annuus]|nr:hypothetical protein HanIR_Chr16g0806071 [Helianthus annuus]KAJ0835280.1 hypothetical protein HanRHA438_Chr16g0753391 [Helianthus annuus]
MAEFKPVRVVEVTVVVVDTWITWWLGFMATYEHQKIIIQMLRTKKMLRKRCSESKRCQIQKMMLQMTFEDAPDPPIEDAPKRCYQI